MPISGRFIDSTSLDWDSRPQASPLCSAVQHCSILCFEHFFSAIASRFCASNKIVPNPNTNPCGNLDAHVTKEDYSHIDVFTHADLDSLALSIEIKMKASNDVLLDHIHSLLGGISSFPTTRLAEIATTFQPNMTLEPLLWGYETEDEGDDTWLHKWLVHFQLYTYLEEKKIQLGVGYLSRKALLWQKELTPQPAPSTHFYQVFCKDQ